MRKYNVAVIGVGAVGEEMLRVLRQRNFPVDQLKVFARSARGCGRRTKLSGRSAQRKFF